MAPSFSSWQLMGILNVTPDSFSDGGRYAGVEGSLNAAWRMMSEGADVIDVGGESTRPGAEPVSLDEELRRVLPVVAALVEAGLPVSVDTAKPEVARRVLQAGARMLNDIHGLRLHPELAELAAEHGAALVVMHMQGTPQTMQQEPRYADVVGEVLDLLERSVRLAEAAGLPRERVFIDPGIGFGKTDEHNRELLRALPRFVATGSPVLLGVSRKSFLGRLLNQPPLERDLATAVVTAYAAGCGVQMHRVHNVRACREALVVQQWLSPPNCRTLP